MRISPILWPLLTLTLAHPAAAHTEKTPQSQRNDRQIQDKTDYGFTAQPQPQNTTLPDDEPQHSISLTAEQLQEHPDLIIRALAAALLQNHAANTAFLQPYYFRLPQQHHDEVLTQWSRAVVAQGRQDYATAVRHYRSIIASRPDLSIVRYRLAQALFADKQWEAAQDQFQKLQSETDIAREHVQPYLEAIRRQDRWELNGGASYVNDRNINNAPKNPDLGGNWRAPEQESGQGISYQLGISKRHSLTDGFFGQWQLDANGRHYWNNPRYNELTLRTSFGGGYHNARHSLVLTPFFEQTWYAGGNPGDKTLHRFSRSSGVAAQWSYQIHPQWQIGLSGEAARHRYRSRVHLNGHSQNLSANILFAASAKQYWLAGADWGRTAARDGDDSYIRGGIRAGWGQEWPKGLSTRVIAAHAHRHYRAAGFFGKRQHNRESSLNVSVWHRNLHFWGITPRLTWHYQKTDSNLPLYTYGKHRVFMEISKQF